MPRYEAGGTQYARLRCHNFYPGFYQVRWGENSRPRGELRRTWKLDDVVTLDLTEFVDPSGIATYFRIPNLAKAVDDELMADCFAQDVSR